MENKFLDYFLHYCYMGPQLQNIFNCMEHHYQLGFGIITILAISKPANREQFLKHYLHGIFKSL